MKLNLHNLPGGGASIQYPDSMVLMHIALLSIERLYLCCHHPLRKIPLLFFFFFLSSSDQVCTNIRHPNGLKKGSKKSIYFLNRRGRKKKRRREVFLMVLLMKMKRTKHGLELPGSRNR